jgi:hypothetical protein
MEAYPAPPGRAGDEVTIGLNAADVFGVRAVEAIAGSDMGGTELVGLPGEPILPRPLQEEK